MGDIKAVCMVGRAEGLVKIEEESAKIKTKSRNELRWRRPKRG